MRRALVIAAAALGCQRAAEAPSAPAATSVTTSAPLTAAGTAALATLIPDPGELLWDVSGDRALFVRLAETPPNADPALRFTARLVSHGSPSRWRYDGKPLAGARLAGDHELVITPDGALLEVRASADRTLDIGVVGAVAASPDGAHLAYMKGEPPDLEIARFDRDGARPVTRGMAPAWSPGISADGRSVFFTSAVTGVPAWWRVDDGGEPVQFTNRDVVIRPGTPPTLSPFAAGLGPTLVSSETIVFEAERGVVVTMTQGGHVLDTWSAAQRPFWVDEGQIVGVITADGASARLLPRAVP